MTRSGLSIARSARIDALVPREGESISGPNFRPDYVVDHETGCWEWQKSRCRGYGMAGQHGRAARAYYKLAHGLDYLAPDIHVHHRCENPGCVNPDHLELLSHSEHLKYHKREISPLTRELVLEIRYRAADGEGIADLASDLGFAYALVKEIIRGVTWRDAGGPIGPQPQDCAHPDCTTPLPLKRRRNMRYCSKRCQQYAWVLDQKEAA